MIPLACVALFALSAGIALFLWIPVLLRFDSGDKSLTLSWMGLSMRKRFGQRTPKKAGEKPQREKGRMTQALARLLLADRDLLSEVLRNAYRALPSVFKALRVREIEGTVSIADPMWNGVLFGILANTSLERVHLSVNFRDVKHLRGSIQVSPCRALRAAAGFLIRFPYRRLVRAALVTKNA